MSYYQCGICGRGFNIRNLIRTCSHCDRPCGRQHCTFCNGIQKDTEVIDKQLPPRTDSGRPYRWDDDGPEEQPA